MIAGRFSHVAIEDLPLSFTAVATDCASGEEVWLRSGGLVDAIRAPMATPLMFTPALRPVRSPRSRRS